jgi:phosphoglucosamine mutase
MSRKLFGTDGIRGQANSGAMTAEMCLRVAQATALQFRRGAHRHLAVIGKDTRLSGYLIEPALTAGLIGMGMDVVLLGPVPTPAVAMLTRSLRADLGIMVSASHNPYSDNGIKLFGPDGFKLSDAVEQAIEARLEQPFESDLAPPADLGRASRLEDAIGRYIEHVKRSFPRQLRLDGLKIVVDCAHGAAYKVAPKVLWELGAEVISIGVNPDGLNINRGCGALHPASVREYVLQHEAHLGIALDGDADRIILVDEKGNVVDGDQILALIAQSWQRQGLLKGNRVAATSMSNLGLERHFATLGLGFERTAVGDRYVVERMRELGLNLGGESSGHIVLADHATTGDGLVAALQVLAELVTTGKPASTLCRVFDPVPQVMLNVPCFRGHNPLEQDEVKAVIAEAGKELSGKGRVLVRKSGTEPVIRVMVEADAPQDVADRIASAIRNAAVSV